MLHFYNIYGLASVFFIRESNKFLFFSEDIKSISILNNNLKFFIESKGVTMFFKNVSIRSVYSGFFVSNYFFEKKANNQVYFSVNDLVLKKYKYELKSIIKSSINCLSLINSINFHISLWVQKFKFVNFYKNIAFSLDFYLYKLLWRWARRFHPRRPNLWIFERYWKNISGRFKFFFFNPLNNKSIFLISHYTSSINLKRFPYSISGFNLFDKSKISYDLFKKLRSEFKGIYGILFDSQKGICPFCNKSFFDFGMVRLKVCHFSGFTFKLNYPFNLVLVHSSCLDMFH